MNEKVTQTDIANHLNISRLTVSKALNNINGVSEDTRNLVLHTAIELGYRKISKNQLITLHSRGLVNAEKQNQSLKQVALFLKLGLATDSYWAPVIRGMVTVLSERGYSLNLCFLTISNGDAFEFPMNFNLKETCGIIQFGDFERKHIEQLKSTGLPMVSIDTMMRKEDVELFSDTIMNINIDPMAGLVEHLVSHGYKRIGYAGERGAQLTMHERWLGYCKGMKKAGREIEEENCFFGGYNEIIAKIEKENRLADLKKFPDAIMCCNDMQAISLMQYFQQNGIRIPEMVAIAGHDNVEQAVIADLTTINVDKEELGKCAAETMLWRIHSPNRPHRMIRLYDAQLIVRGTTNGLKLKEKDEG